MAIEREVLRKNVEKHIALASATGTWEDQHSDFKLELLNTANALGKVLKLLLAFSNTPRNRDAYIIYGVTERSPVGYAHVGAGQFPAKDFTYWVDQQGLAARSLTERSFERFGRHPRRREGT